MSALEMTDDQLEAVHREIANGTTFTVFNLIRDMVLEAAAKECSGPDQAPFFVERIRSLKGPPP